MRVSITPDIDNSAANDWDFRRTGRQLVVWTAAHMKLSNWPEAGESCYFENVRFEILEADERRIHSVKVTVGD